MAFTSAPTIDIAGVGSGQPSDIFYKFILSAEAFEDGLQIGRFAKLDTGSIDNMDASATPVLAGVIARSVANPIEDGDTYKTANTISVEYVRAGIVTVEVKVGQTPTKFGAVFAHNLADADAGKAVTTVTNAVATTAEFISEISPNVWTIRLK
jgi:hypothetical protein